jgi:hypothetical protein
VVSYTDIVDIGRLAAGGLQDLATGLFRPTVRLGVTGLSRSGKTVFITALVNALLIGARLPAFEVQARGRISRCYLEPQPDDELPRFPFEENLHRLAELQSWPESTRKISQLRLTIEYEPHGMLARSLGSGKLHIDIVDYPGEWLLDLPLMRLSYADWSAATLEAARREPRRKYAEGFLSLVSALQANRPAEEPVVREAASKFTGYLSRCREADPSLAMLPPGRFLMPGDLEGSPLLTFAPLDINPGEKIDSSSLAGLMRRRYDSYVSMVVRPFFFRHFSRINRQIVLVDALTALNTGSAAVADLQRTLADVLQVFRVGGNTLVTEVFGRRIDRVLFAATKADLLNHQDHDNLESIMRELVDGAAKRTDYSGASFGVSAVAAIRATREATVTQGGEELRCIVGTPENGETLSGKHFDGDVEAAVFPGDLPENAKAVWDGSLEGRLHFVRFRPPVPVKGSFPHIRLDRSLEFLLGDCFP